MVVRVDQRVLGADVHEKALPDLSAALMGQDRLIPDPDDVSVAVDHPVLADGGNVAASRRRELPALDSQHRLAVVGMQAANVVGRVPHPFLRLVAEQRVKVAADVVPGAPRARLRLVDHCRHGLDERA